MMWIGIVLMALGVIGVLVFAKMKNQPGAAGSAVLMLIGLGVYMWFYMNPPPDLSGQYYRMAIAAKVAKDVQGAKYWLTTDVNSEYAKKTQEAYKKAGGTAEWKSVAGEEGGGMMDSKIIEQVLTEAGKDALVIIDFSVMESSDVINKLLKAKKCPKMFFVEGQLTGIGGAKGNGVEKLFNDGTIVGAVAYLDNVDKEFKPSEDDLEEAFTKRYMMINKDNFKDNKAKLGLDMGK